MSDTASLSETVTRIEQAAERKADAENVEERVRTADRELRRINVQLENLADEVDRLQFYRQILNECFDDSEPATVELALEQAENVIDKSRDDLVKALRDGDTSDYLDQLSDAVDTVENARRQVRNRLKDQHWSDWEDRISSAQELQQIVGDQNDEFSTVIADIKQHIQDRMQDPSNRTRDVIRGWENAVAEWKKHRDMQGLSAFQETHDLSDEAVEAIRTLSQDSMRLADIDMRVLQELKDIPDLRNAIELEI